MWGQLSGTVSWKQTGPPLVGLEKAMASVCSVLAWKIPGMGEPGGLPSMGGTESDTTEVTAAAAACGVSLATAIRGLHIYLTFFLIFIEFVATLFLVYVLVWGPQGMWILAPPPGIELTPSASEGEVLTTGLSGTPLYLTFDPAVPHVGKYSTSSRGWF